MATSMKISAQCSIVIKYHQILSLVHPYSSEFVVLVHSAMHRKI